MRKVYAEDSFSLELMHTVYALDSTTIDLCLVRFPWAPDRQQIIWIDATRRPDGK